MTGKLMEPRPARREVKKIGIRIEKPQMLPASVPPAATPVLAPATKPLNFLFLLILFLSYFFSACALYFAWLAS